MQVWSALELDHAWTVEQALQTSLPQKSQVRLSKAVAAQYVRRSQRVLGLSVQLSRLGLLDWRLDLLVIAQQQHLGWIDRPEASAQHPWAQILLANHHHWFAAAAAPALPRPSSLAR